MKENRYDDIDAYIKKRAKLIAEMQPRDDGSSLAGMLLLLTWLSVIFLICSMGVFLLSH